MVEGLAITTAYRDVATPMSSRRFYAPSTYEERGTAIPFTSTLLKGARVRRGYRQGLEVLIPGFAEARGTYVVPWGALPDIASLNLHDRMLQKLVLRDNALSPDQVRRVATRVAKTGVAGPAAAVAATTAISAETEAVTATHLHLLVELLSRCGLATADIVEQLGTGGGEEVIKGALTAMASDIGIGSSELDGRIEALSVISAPLGARGMRHPARLRCLLDRVDRFGRSCSDWSERNPSDSAALADFCAAVADHTFRIATRLMADYDTRICDIIAVLSRWLEQKTAIEALADRLSWLLDGWDIVASWWERVQQGPTDEQTNAIHGIFRILPIIPKQEWTQEQGSDAEMTLYGGRKWVRALESWKTGRVDQELVGRLEQAELKGRIGKNSNHGR